MVGVVGVKDESRREEERGRRLYKQNKMAKQTGDCAIPLQSPMLSPMGGMLLMAYVDIYPLESARNTKHSLP